MGDVEAVKQVLQCAAKEIKEREAELNRLDSQGGDGDHGVTFMVIQNELVQASVEYQGKGVGGLFSLGGRRILGRVGGASGLLWGSALVQIGKVLSDRPEMGVAEISVALHAGLEAVVARGKAQEGDKTMVDAWGPAARAVAAYTGGSTVEVLTCAADAARAGALATEGITAKLGRSARLGERTLGVADPGATSLALWLEALARCTGEGCQS